MGFVTKNTGLAKRTGYFFRGKELALHGQSGIPVKRPRHNGAWYPETVKIECATMFAVTKDFDKTHELTKVKRSVIVGWSREPWWDSVVAEVKKVKNGQLDAKITQVLHDGVDIIIDRFKNGDIYVDHNSKEKEQYRVPIKARDAAQTAAVLFDKRQLLRGEATTRSENTSTEQKFLLLKENFEKLAKSKLINNNSEIIEGDPIATSSEQEPVEQNSELRQTQEFPEEAENQEVLESESISINPLGAQ